MPLGKVGAAAAARLGPPAAAAAKKAVKGGAIAAGAWIAKKYGEKVADEAFEKGMTKATETAEDKKHRTLAEDLASARGWKYTERTVIDGRHRYVVWNDELKPVAAFPQVDEARTPEALAERYELKGHKPSNLIDPSQKRT